MQGFFGKLKDGMEKTRGKIAGRIQEIFSYYRNINDEFFDDVEDVLVSSDIGVDTSVFLVRELREALKQEKTGDPERVYAALRSIIAAQMDTEPLELSPPSVVLMVGVNGTGKTTTCGKLAHIYKSRGKKVMLAAADTFRAAAIEQLSEWGARNGIEVIRQSAGSDPAAVVFDAVGAARSRKADLLICDTAGRLHNKKNLMNELSKVRRVIESNWPEAQVETLLVLDATTGQNAISQTKEFLQSCSVTGIVLTKLDGTAKGGVAIAIKRETGIPVRFVGVGEGIDDLQEFSADEFARAII